MRIAVVSTSGLPTPPERYGGIERVAHQLAEGLTDLGDDVTVFARAGSRGGRYRLVEREEGEWYPPLRELREYDAVSMHQTGWRGLQGPRGEMATLRVLLGLARAVPTVYTFHHGLSYWVRPLRASGLWPRRLFATTPSAPQADYARRHGLARVSFVPNPVEDGTFRPRERKTDELCFVASLTRRKAPDFAIRVARAAGRPLVLAGPKGEPGFFEEAVQPELDAYPSARYAGEITAAEKDDLLSRSAALLHTTRGEEPFGLIVAEAIVRGTPCISSDSGAPRRIVEETGGGRVVGPPDDPKAWADALEDLLARPPDARAMREACLARYGAQAVARRHRRVIEQAISGRPEPAGGQG